MLHFDNRCHMMLHACLARLYSGIGCWGVQGGGVGSTPCRSHEHGPTRYVLFNALVFLARISVQSWQNIISSFATVVSTSSEVVVFVLDVSLFLASCCCEHRRHAQLSVVVVREAVLFRPAAIPANSDLYIPYNVCCVTLSFGQWIA